MLEEGLRVHFLLKFEFFTCVMYEKEETVEPEFESRLGWTQVSGSEETRIISEGKLSPKMV